MRKQSAKTSFDLFLLLGIIFVTVNLRAPITAVGPLISSMKLELPFSNGVFGLLTTIPLIMFAVLSPFVRRISDKLGAGRTLLAAVATIAFGVVLRSYAGNGGLFLGTVLLGAGIAVGNVLVPGVIKARFPEHIGLATGAFTVSMTTFAAVSSGVSYPLSALPGMGWRNSLAVWLVLTAVGMIAWLPQRKMTLSVANVSQPDKPRSESVWRSKTAWWLTILMGAQSFLFYFFTAWLPTIALAKGLSSASAGYIAFVFQLSSFPAAFLIPAVATRLKDQRGLITVVSALYFASLVMLAFAQAFAPLAVAVALYGFSTGACFNLCLLLISLRTRSAERATSLSGMVQSVGYAIGALGPILGGWMLDLTGSWTAAFVCVAALIVVIFFAGRQAGQNRYI